MVFSFKRKSVLQHAHVVHGGDFCFLHAGCLNITVVNISIGSRCLHKYFSWKQQLPDILGWLYQLEITIFLICYFLSLSLCIKCNNLANCYNIIYLNRPRTSVINSDYVLCIWNTYFFSRPWLQTQAADGFCEEFRQGIETIIPLCHFKNVIKLFCADSGYWKTSHFTAIQN